MGEREGGAASIRLEGGARGSDARSAASSFIFRVLGSSVARDGGWRTSVNGIWGRVRDEGKLEFKLYRN